MPKTKKPKIDYAAELQKSFNQWEHLLTHGGSDPTWSDGVNMNLVRTHIIIGKRNIEENMAAGDYPEIYYRVTPPETNQDYMARADEIRGNAEKSLEVYKADPDYQFLCRRVIRLTERQRKETYIGAVIGYAEGLEKAIHDGDLITMRRHERASRYTDSFASCAERVRNLKPPEIEQMSLFDICGDDMDYDDEWDDEI